MELNLRKKIEYRRKKMGLLKKDIYNQLGMTATGYHNMLERDRTTVDRLFSLSKILNVHPSYFFNEEGKEPENDLLHELREKEQMWERRFEQQSKQIAELKQTINVLSNAIQQLTSMQMGKPNGSKKFKQRLRLLPTVVNARRA